MYSLCLPYPVWGGPRLDILSNNTFTVATGNISVHNSAQTSVIIGSQAGNQVSVGGPLFLR